MSGSSVITLSFLVVYVLKHINSMHFMLTTDSQDLAGLPHMEGSFTYASLRKETKCLFQQLLDLSVIWLVNMQSSSVAMLLVVQEPSKRLYIFIIDHYQNQSDHITYWTPLHSSKSLCCLLFEFRLIC